MSQAVADAIAREMGLRGVPGVSAVTVEDGAIAWTGTFGVRRAGGDPVTVDTIFEAASISKPVFAWRVLDLCAAGVLDLDAPLNEYASERFALEEPATWITARMLLTHTSALSWEFSGKGDEGRLFVSGLPGAEFRYSGVGFEFLRTALRRLVGGGPTRDDMRDFMSELGMTRSSYGWDPSFEDDYASPHDLDGGALEKEKIDRLRYVSGDLHSTAKDLAAFLSTLVGSSRSSAHEAALEPQVEVHQEFPHGPPAPGAHWGLGIGVWLVGGERTIWQWGENPGFQSILLGWPAQRRGIVVLTNSDHGHWVSRAAVRAFAGCDHPAFSWIEN